MKLKELDSLVSSIAKQDKIIQETQANIISVRQEIDTITQMVSQQPRKRYNSTTTSKKQHQSMSMTPRVEAEQSVLLPPAPTTRNDKNRPEEL
jgi:septal ring factor EnvC (AmiA/AmiB activator)